MFDEKKLETERRYEEFKEKLRSRELENASKLETGLLRLSYWLRDLFKYKRQKEYRLFKRLCKERGEIVEWEDVELVFKLTSKIHSEYFISTVIDFHEVLEEHEAI